MNDLQLIPQILIKAAPTPLPPQVAPRSSKSLLHIGQGSTQLCLHGEVHLQQSGKNPISAQPPSPFHPVSEGAAAPWAPSQYQFVPQGLDAGDVAELLPAHHGVHVLHLAAQAAHCHRVEVGIPDPQRGLEGTKNQP